MVHNIFPAEMKSKASYNKKLLVIITVFVLSSIILLSHKESSNLDRPHLIKNIIEKQFALYPEMKIQDLYKFIHQAAMGSEHAVKDPASAQKWMDDELANMNTDYQNELCDTLTPGGKLVRVNLRPFIKLGNNAESLVDAFIKTANNYLGSEDTLKYFWSIALKLADEGNIPLNKSEMFSYIKEKGKQGFPPVHHSEVYEKLYHPAYRVVSNDYLNFMKRK